jgi:hypothetical protein
VRQQLASFFWIYMVREKAARGMLFELDKAVQGLRRQVGDNEHVVSLAGHYHNLVRRWAVARGSYELRNRSSRAVHCTYVDRIDPGDLAGGAGPVRQSVGL